CAMLLSCDFSFLISFIVCFFFFFFSSRRRHTRSKRDWSSDVCSSDLSSQIIQLLHFLVTQMFSPTTLRSKLLSLGSSRFARRYCGNRISFSSCGYLDVSVPHVYLQLSYEFT